jgi:hypothetical protein
LSLQGHLLSTLGSFPTPFILASFSFGGIALSRRSGLTFAGCPLALLLLIALAARPFSITYLSCRGSTTQNENEKEKSTHLPKRFSMKANLLSPINPYLCTPCPGTPCSSTLFMAVIKLGD